jgi:hypothetical protein
MTSISRELGKPLLTVATRVHVIRGTAKQVRILVALQQD